MSNIRYHNVYYPNMFNTVSINDVTMDKKEVITDTIMNAGVHNVLIKLYVVNEKIRMFIIVNKMLKIKSFLILYTNVIKK